MRILLAEPKLTFAESIASRLREDGHEVIVAHDGVENIAAIRHAGPEAVIMSLNLEHGEGGRLVEILDRDETFKRTRLITTCSEMQDGCSAHLSAPYSFEDLKHHLVQLFPDEEARAAARLPAKP